MKETNLNNILYQKIGNLWYIFSETKDGEILYSVLSEGIDPRKIDRELIYLLQEEKSAPVKEKSKAPRPLEKRA